MSDDAQALRADMVNALGNENGLSEAWRGAYGMVHLTVADNGTASGPFVDPAAFMRLRAQQIEFARMAEIITGEDTARHRESALDPRAITGDFDAQFALSMQLPGIFQATGADDDGATTVWFAELDGRSWAAVDSNPDGDTHSVSEQGPRSLWTEIEAACAWWVDHDTPAFDSFGLTVTPDRQHVWHDNPESGHTWPVPTP